MQKVIIVAGISSAGKSTFIERVLQPKFNFLKSDVKFAGKLSESFDLGSSDCCVVHYNLLLQFDWERSRQAISLHEEPVFKKLLEECGGADVFLIFAPINELQDRIRSRRYVEPYFLATTGRYPSDEICKRLNRVDQRALLIEFGDAFEEFGSSISVWISEKGNSHGVSFGEFKKLGM